MTNQANDNQPLKCPHCACIFFNKEDLQSHLQAFGTNKAEHESAYHRVHGRLEHGYDEG